MTEIIFLGDLSEVFEKTLFTITDQKVTAVVDVFLTWLNTDAQLKPLPDLPQRILDIAPQLKRMAKNLKISFEKGKLVIKTDADSETLLNLLRRGSDWYSPHPDVNAAILLGLTNGSQPS